MKVKEFDDINGNVLVVKNRKHAIIFEEKGIESDDGYKFAFKFTEEDFVKLISYLESASNESWVKFDPKEADSFGADYFEYYDRKFDNNGYLTLKKNELVFKKPVNTSNKLYQLNKRKAESLLYDLKQ